MRFSFNSIGFIHTRTANEDIPRHWSVSTVRGHLDMDREVLDGLADITPGDTIVVLFAFHRSQRFTPALLKQTPPHQERAKGVFSICSPVRPNPIGMSILTVLSVNGRRIDVQGLDMFDGTPVLDLKPHIVHPAD